MIRRTRTDLPLQLVTDRPTDRAETREPGPASRFLPQPLVLPLHDNMFLQRLRCFSSQRLQPLSLRRLVNSTNT
ncbi:hypothetical protein F2P81_012390 [Scophthalmus maximus]|uniref:Uncharacterized protein n=1 Tax=Scophthalmus maximus TaxID=52904 RepID=A0A6A4SX34_SCOMX|nr:hypothetical protein F2P81_012390 [Scophthalmus maximus]